ncbi:MAG TPA: hypothetical protein PLF91_12295 [Mycolicibacterium fallax]|nr:hypothetical protein [Mycolicibacterium fallax]HSA39007.1 hypothetical protein [Mycobacterium sp.]
MTAQSLAAAWEDGLSPALAGLAAVLEPHDVELDYSVESLRALEGLVLGLFDTPQDVLAESDRALVRGLLAYIGLTLVHLAGGNWGWDDEAGFALRGRPELPEAQLAGAVAAQRWGWDGSVEAPGLPVAVPPENLGLAPISPLHTLLRVVAERSGGEGALVRAYRDWLAVVGSAPTTGVVGIDIYDRPKPSPLLDSWLAERRADFAAWSARYPGNWDFSPDSVDELLRVVRAQTPTAEEFNEPANADLAAGASWYLGEMLVRGAPSLWIYMDYDNLVLSRLVDEGDSRLACYSVQSADDVAYLTPFYLLQYSLETGRPEARTSYDTWCAFADPGAAPA